jgi:NADH-quinone oxidoreductase subunit J
MTIAQIIFYVFASIAALSALMVITQNNPVKCVLFLVLTFFASSVLWLLAEAEFLSLILVLVYVGAVMTLFLFVVMMLNIDTESMKSHFRRYLPFGLILVALLLGLLLISMPKIFAETSVEQASQIVTVAKTMSNTEALGMVLYTDYLYGFEIAAIILLVAIISAITLVHRTRGQTKRQDIVKQLLTQKSDRLSIVKMSPYKKG